MVDIENHHQLLKIINEEKITIVDFHADWCGPCQVLNGNLDDLLGKYDAEVSLAKVNVDRNASLISNLSIKSIPSLFFFKKGQIVDDLVGVKSVNEIEQKLFALKD